MIDQILTVAREHAPEGGYGETAYNAGEGTVYWVPADWSTNDEIDAAHSAFMQIDGVNGVVGDAEAALPTGEEWTRVYPEPGSEEAYERVLALAMRPLSVREPPEGDDPHLTSDGRLRLAEHALDTIDGALRIVHESA